MRRVKKTFTDFSVWTCAAGLPNLGRAKSPYMRCFWGFLFMVCFAAFIYQMVYQFNKYLQYPFTIQTELRFQTLPYPAVTICHLNALKLSAVMANGQLKDLVNAYELSVTNELVPEKDLWGLLNTNQTMERQAIAENSMLFYVAAMSQEGKQNLSYTQNELIHSCYFNQKRCKSNFKQAFYPNYGNCFTFNWNLQLNTTRAGPANGLRLLLITKLEEYLPFAKSAGVRVTINGKDDISNIFPDSFGCNAATGFATSFSLQYLESNRLGPPYSNCKHETEDYSSERCTRECTQSFVNSQCGCSSPAFDLAPGSQYCAFDKSQCIRDATFEFRNSNNSEGICNCQQPCRQSSFRLTASASIWPSKNHEAFDCTDIKGDFQACKEWYRKNSLLIQIFFERINFQATKETETYGPVDLLSDFGGNMGLWIGFSVITAVEILFLPSMICTKCLKTRRSKEAGDLGAVETDFSDERDNEFDKVGGDNNPPPPYSGQPFDVRRLQGNLTTVTKHGKKSPTDENIRKIKLGDSSSKYKIVSTLSSAEPPILK